MSETSAAASETEAQAVTAAVEVELDKERAIAGLSDAEKQARALQVYTAWRNASLRGLSQQAFAQVEAASGALVAAIAAQIS